MVYLPGHELHHIDVVRTKTHQKGKEDEQNDGVGPVFPSQSAHDGVLLGRCMQFQVDLGVADHDGDERTAEGEGAGQQQEVGSEAGPVEVEVLHAGSSFLMLVKCAAKQQRGYLQAHQSPHQVADPADHLDAPQTLQPVWMHHGQVPVQADTSHEANA